MGITNLFKLFEGTQVTLAKYKNKILVYDALIEVYRANYGIRTPLVFNGKVTSGVSIIFHNVLECRRLGITPIYIFDNQACAMKSETITKRTTKLTKYMVSDAKKLLNLLGVDIIIAPDCFEAEQLGARMVADGSADALVTKDADALLFGAPIMLKKEKGKKFTEYNLDDVLSALDTDIEGLRKIGVVLGCDFAPKVKGIGLKTVLKKYKDAVLDDRQQEAMEYFGKKVPDGTLVKGLQDLDALQEWMVTELGFNKTLLIKKLKKI